MQSQFSAIAAHVEYINSKQLIIFAWYSQVAAFTVSSYDREEDVATTMAARNKTAMCCKKEKETETQEWLKRQAIMSVIGYSPLA